MKEDIKNTFFLPNVTGFCSAVHPTNSNGTILFKSKVDKSFFFAQSPVDKVNYFAKYFDSAYDTYLSTICYVGKPLLFNFLSTNVLFVKVKQEEQEFNDVVCKITEKLFSIGIPKYSFVTFDGEECTFIWLINGEIKFKEIGLYIQAQIALAEIFSEVRSINFDLGNTEFLRIPGTKNKLTNKFVDVDLCKLQKHEKLSLLNSILSSERVDLKLSVFSQVYTSLRKLYDQRWFDYSFEPQKLDSGIIWLSLIFGCLSNIYSQEKIRKELVAFCESFSNQPWSMVKNIYIPIIDKLVQDSKNDLIFINGVKFSIHSTDWLSPAIEQLNLTDEELLIPELKRLHEIQLGDLTTSFMSSHSPEHPIGDFKITNIEKFVRMLDKSIAA